MKTAEELIEAIRVNAPNLYHIAETGEINGTLHADLKVTIESLLEQLSALTKENEQMKAEIVQLRKEK